MNLIALPAFSDNYIWMLHDGTNAIVVDPGQDAPVQSALDQHSLTLAGILVTHHHADHVGGVDALRARLRGPVYGPRRESIPRPYTPLDEGDVVELLGCRFDVIDVPGHTAGHIAYFERGVRVHIESLEEHSANDIKPLLFCGDTLFSAGCGKLFEGTPEQMHDSLSKLSALPDQTLVCCAHEYTLSNLKFARAVEPLNQATSAHLIWCTQRRAQGLPTLPSSIDTERRINPFLRCAEPDVATSAHLHGATSGAPESEVLAALRQWKNEYR